MTNPYRTPDGSRFDRHPACVCPRPDGELEVIPGPYSPRLVPVEPCPVHVERDFYRWEGCSFCGHDDHEKDACPYYGPFETIAAAR